MPDVWLEVLLETKPLPVAPGGGRCRHMHHKKVYKALVKDELFLAWLRKQAKPIRQEVHTCDASVYLLHTCDDSVYLLVMLQYTCFSNLLCHVCLQCSVILCLKCLV